MIYLSNKYKPCVYYSHLETQYNTYSKVPTMYLNENIGMSTNFVIF